MPRHNPIDDTVPQRIARYGDLVPYKDSMSRSDNIPPEAMTMMSPDKVMPVMSPLGWEGRSKIAPVKGAPGLTITLAECPPGDSAGLHKHTNAVENFFCVQGVFEITWGDEGQFSTQLHPLDFISVPAGVYRDFKNVGTEMGRLLVMIQPMPGDTQDAVYHAESTGREIVQRWGEDTLQAMARIGIRFGEPAA
ncbi:MAG: cupin domain-containing protein [Betaproteobacteria bacterium]|nr:cupin domain-containing protein [Betaproteobacteria bacterium]